MQEERAGKRAVSVLEVVMGRDGYGGTWPEGLFGQRSPVVPHTSEPGRGLSTRTSLVLSKPDMQLPAPN
jgi:hypothetical protein